MCMRYSKSEREECWKITLFFSKKERIYAKMLLRHLSPGHSRLNSKKYKDTRISSRQSGSLNWFLEQRPKINSSCYY